MTNVESFEDRSKAQNFAKQYAQQHRIMTRIVSKDDHWIVQASERRHGPTQLQSQPPEPKPQQTPSPIIGANQLPTDEKQRLSHFALVEQLLALDKPEERERRLKQLCTTWGGRLYAARKVLREMFNQQDEPRKLSGRLRRRLRERGIIQFDYLSAARRAAQSACQTAAIPHFAAIGKHTVRGDFWVFIDTLPRHGNPVDLIEIYRKSDSRVGWWCERLSTPSYIATWDIELRDPANGDILHVHRRGINGKSVALRVLSETPNFELVAVVEADANWAEAVPYDTIEAIVADTEDEEAVQALLAD